MNQDPFRLPLAARLTSFAFAAMMSLGMLFGVNALSTGEPDPALLARAQLSAKA